MERRLGIILLIATLVPTGCLGGDQFSGTNPAYFNRVGKITLRPSSNEELCITTAQLNVKSSIMKLAPCDEENFEDMRNAQVFEQGEVTSSKVYELRTTHIPLKKVKVQVEMKDPVELGCMISDDVRFPFPVVTTKCDYDNIYQHWQFKQVKKTKNFQWIHKESEQCVQAPRVQNGVAVMLVDCNEKDKNQLWTMENHSIKEIVDIFKSLTPF